ncbi:FecR domain-containing protein [Cytophagales bacterium LB-30]|uniref:FecR domain-containing protein n=1 Tax=Shiella aurantiaca TaxID=3058365 RepID=A0ABT8F6I6_9BACT|nr:FecR domain-containing protein [Shiella aurantiaca]MDN4166093.1 FecR domain-containing protein [Shiella aurantiaca]
MKTNWELLAKYLHGECSAEEITEVEMWLQQSVKNQALLNSLKQYKAKPKQFPVVNFDEFKEKDWQRILAKVSDKGHRINPWYNTYFKIAASITFLIMSLGLVYYLAVRSEPFMIVETSNATKEVWLPDSTYVVLNKNSKLEVMKPYNLKERKVKLNGEAYFQVRPNKQAPFSIESHSLTTTVLGTTFNIKAYSDSAINVSVEEGRVLVESANDRAVLSKEMSVKYTHRKLIIDSRYNSNQLAWKTGIIRFENESIQYVVEFLSEHYDRKVSISTEKAHDQKITVELKQLTLEEALEVITFTLDLNFRDSPEGFEIY